MTRPSASRELYKETPCECWSDTLRYMTHEVQHLVTYQEGDDIQHFLTALVDNSSIPFLCDCDIYHGESLFKPCQLNPRLHITQ